MPSSFLARISGRKKSCVEQKPEQQKPSKQPADFQQEPEPDGFEVSFTDGIPAGVPCTEDGVPLKIDPDHAAAAPAAPPLRTAAAVAPDEVLPAAPDDLLHKTLMQLYHPKRAMHGGAARMLALLTSEQSNEAGRARVAAFSHVSRLISLLDSSDKQVSLDVAHVLDDMFLLDDAQQAAAAEAPDALPQLVVALSSKDPVVRVAAAELMWLLIVPGNNPASAAAAALPGVISTLQEVMLDSNNKLLQQKGTQLLWCLIPQMDTRATPADLMCIRGVTSAIVDLLYQADPANQATAALHLAWFGKCADCLLPWAVDGVFATLIGWLRSGDAERQELALAALSGLTYCTPDYRSRVTSEPGILDMVLGWALLAPAGCSHAVQVLAMELLASLMKGEAYAAIHAAVTAAPDRVVQQLHGESSSVQRVGAEMIGSLARQDPDLRKAFSSVPGCLQGLVTLLGSSDEEVQHRAAAALSRLTIPPLDKNQRILVSCPGCLDHLVSLLCSNNEQAQAHAALALHAFAAGNRRNRIAMRNHPSCLQVLSQLSCDSKRGQVQLMAILILRWFIRNWQARQQLDAGQLTYMALLAALPAPAPLPSPAERPDPGPDNESDSEEVREYPQPQGCYYVLKPGDTTPWYTSAWLSLKAGIIRRSRKSMAPHRARGFGHRVSEDIQAAWPGC